MKIQPPLPRHCGKVEIRRQNAECPAPKPRENNFRVAARRQTAANFPPLFQSAALCRGAATPNNLEILADVPGITSLEWRAMQKSPISRILPHPPAFAPRGRGGKCGILYSSVPRRVGIRRNILFFQSARPLGRDITFSEWASWTRTTHHAITGKFPAYSRLP